MSASAQAVPTKILEARKRIDQFDRQIAHLCAERVKKAELILKNKSKHNISKRDRLREQKILQNYLKKIKARYADVSEKSVKDFVRSLMKLTPNYKKTRARKGRFYGKTTH